jgi:integrase
LHALVQAASARSSGNRAARDRAIVALHCWSGLRPEEIVALKWEDLRVGRTSRDETKCAVTICRTGQAITLPILDRAFGALESLAIHHSGWIGVLNGYVFRAHRREERPLSYRATREVLRAACIDAGLPAVDASQLRAAFASWLKLQGLSDHEVALVLGLRIVRSVDRLLLRHTQLNAQRRVRELLG